MMREISAQLRQYEQDKFELAEILRAILVAVSKADPRDGQSPRREIEALLTRLAEDRFVLLVAGRFSRGKTSLMNAILGMDRLPTGILPLTSVITVVAYGSDERVRIEFQSGGLPLEIPIEDLAAHITERGNPGNSRRIRLARVELPAEILRRGFHFVDSPGLGSAIQENSQTTESFFPEADAVIVVSGFDGPLSDEEVRAIRTFTDTRRPVFLVLNKQDVVSPAARAEVLSFVHERFARIVPEERARIFALSAKEGLAAKLSGDRAGFASSGVAEFETALTRFLVEDKRSVFITSVCERLRSLIEHTGEGLADRVLKARLDQVLDRWTEPARTGKDPAASFEGARLEECLLCARVRDTVFEFLRKHQYQLATEPQARARLATTGGLCARHLWLYAAVAANRDMCLGLAPLMERIASYLTANDGAGYGPLLEPPNPLASCELCVVEQRIEACVIDKLSKHVDSTDRLPTVCMPHLRAIGRYGADCAPDQAARERIRTLLEALRRRQGKAAARLAEDMQRYALKRDGTRHALVTDEEARAAQRAVAFLAGMRNVPRHN